MKLDLNLVLVFDALLRHRNVSNAAGSLGITQSAASKSLKRLRNYYDDALFFKVQGGVYPTERALQLEEHVRAFIAASRPIANAPTFDPKTESRTIVINVDSTGELIIVPILMERLREAAPRCRLRTVFEDVAHGLRSGSIDLAIDGGLDLNNNFRQQKLYEHSFAIIGHKDCPIQEVSTEDLIAMRQVAVTMVHSAGRRIREVLSQLELGYPAISVSSWLSVPPIVSQDPSYFAVVPRVIADTFALHSNIKLLHPRFEIPYVEVVQYWYADSDRDSFNLWLRKLVRQALFKKPPLHVV